MKNQFNNHITTTHIWHDRLMIMQAAIRFITFVTIAMILTVCACKKSPDKGQETAQPAEQAQESNGVRYVVSKDGLIMREKPDKNSPKVELIPLGEKVDFISEEKETLSLAGEYGKWTRISWKGKAGWAFGGFLREYNINDVKKIAADYLRADCDNCPMPKEKDITIIQVLGNLVHLNFVSIKHDSEPGTAKYESLWSFSNGKWTFVKGRWEKARMISVIKLLYLNNDTYPDCIEEFPVDERSGYSINLGTKSGGLDYVQSISCTTENLKKENTQFGHCGEFVIKCSGDFNIWEANVNKPKEKAGSPARLTFNCKSNRFE